MDGVSRFLCTGYSAKQNIPGIKTKDVADLNIKFQTVKKLIKSCLLSDPK